MKSLLPILATIFLFYQTAPAQKSPLKPDPNYKDQLDKGSKLKYSTYTKSCEKAKDGGYIIKHYYPDTKQMTHYIRTLDRKGKQREKPTPFMSGRLRPRCPVFGRRPALFLGRNRMIQFSWSTRPTPVTQTAFSKFSIHSGRALSSRWKMIHLFCYVKPITAY